MLGVHSPVLADSLTWDGNGVTTPNPNGGTGAWDTSTSNWWNGFGNVLWPGSGTNNDAVFAGTAGTVTIAAGGVTVNDLTFNTTGYTISGGPLTLNGSAPALTTGTGVTAGISSSIAGSSGLAKSGLGTLTLSGSNSYSGATTVSGGGLLIISHASALGATGSANGTTVSNANQLRLIGGITADAEPITITGNGHNPSVTEGRGALRSHGGNNTWTGPITVTGGVETWISSSDTFTISGGVTGNNQTLRMDQGTRIVTNDPVNLGASGHLKINSITRLQVAGNTFGSLTVDWSGVLYNDVAGAVPANVTLILGANNVNPSAGKGTVDLSGHDLTVARLMDGGTAFADEKITNTSATAAIFTVNGAVDSTFQGVLLSNLALTKDGVATLTLSGSAANTYTGTTTVNAGTLVLGKAAGVAAVPGHITVGDSSGSDILKLAASHQIADSAVLTLNGTALNQCGGFRLNGHSETVGGLSGDGFVEHNIDDSGTGSPSSALTLNVASGTQTHQGVIRNTGGSSTGTLSLSKTGAGTQVLTGANTYTGGTQVSAGTLLVNNTADSGTGSGAISVAAGATLGGSGIIAGATTISGIHAPGNSPGIQTFGSDLTYTAGAAVNWELAENTISNSPVAFDQIVVGGNLAFTGATTLNLSFNGAGSAVDWNDSFWTTDRQWLVWDVTGTASGFSNLSLAAIDWLDKNNLAFQSKFTQGQGFSLSQSGNDIYLNFLTSAVPEPGTGAVLALAVGMLGLGFRRRRG